MTLGHKLLMYVRRREEFDEEETEVVKGKISLVVEKCMGQLLFSHFSFIFGNFAFFVNGWAFSDSSVFQTYL